MSGYGELLALADAATPGPWAADIRGDGRAWVDAPNIDGHAFSLHGLSNDAAFIAAANPTAVKALAEEVLTLRGKVERVGLEVLTWEQTAETLRAPEDPDEEHLVVAEVLESRAYRIRAALGDDR